MHSVICTKCGLGKPATIEYFHKSRGGLSSACKVCRAVYAKNYKRDNPEKLRESKRKYREGNRDKINAAGKVYRQANKEATNMRTRAWQKSNPDKVRATCRRYREANSEAVRGSVRRYREANPLKVANARRKHYLNNPNARLAKTLRNRVNSAIKGSLKSASTLELLGCSVEFLKLHLEAKFKKGMAWENRRKWHIDHIRPCASFDLTDPEQQRQCFHYSNLQPLWAFENQEKKDKWKAI